MNYPRIVLLNLFLVTLCIAEEQKKITLQDIGGHAQFWATKYVPDLNSDDATLLANLLYFSGKYIESQIKVGNSILFAYVHAGMINNLVLVSEEDAKKVALASAVALRKLKEEYLPERNTNAKILKHCTETLQKSEHTQVKTLMDGFEEYGQAIIAQFTRQDAESIKGNIEECNTAFTQHLPTINHSNDTLKAIVQNRNPYLKENNDPDITNLHTALMAADNAIMTLSDMINKAIRIKRMSFDIMNISKMIAQNFYQHTLFVLEQEKRTPLFIMFNEEGLIAPEDRWQDLPSLVENREKN